MSLTSHRAHSPQPSSLIRNGVLMLAAGLCLVATVAIWSLLTGSFDDTSVRVLLSGLAAAMCTLGGLAGAAALSLETGRRPVGVATIALSQLALLATLALIWIPDAGENDPLMRSFGVTITLMLAGAHASLMLARLRRSDTRGIRGLTQAAITCATSAALLFSGVLATAEGSVAPAVWRVLGVLIVLAVLGTLLVPLARRINRARSA
jgi:hypothetical protein